MPRWAMMILACGCVALASCSKEVRLALAPEPGSVGIPYKSEVQPEAVREAVAGWARDSFHYERKTLDEGIDVMTWQCVEHRVLVTVGNAVTSEVGSAEFSSVVFVSVYVQGGIDEALTAELAGVIEAGLALDR